MDENEDYFISLPNAYGSNKGDQQSGRPLFSQQSEEYDEQEQIKEKRGEQQCQDDEVIDEELLSKMSQLHESLRNKKLLQFELIQAKIMKAQNHKDSNAIVEQIQKLKIESIEAEIESKSNQRDIQQLKREIEQQKEKNRKHLKQIEEANHKIVKTKQRREQIMQKDQFKENINTENKFVSIEKMRLAAENQSKEQIIQQIKLSIGEMKSKIVMKEQQHKSLQDQYQLLLTQIKQEQKKEQKREKNKVSINQPSNNLSMCQHQISTQHDKMHEISKSTASIHKQFKSTKQSNQAQQSLVKPKKVVQNDNRSVANSTKTKKKDKIKSIR